MPPAPKPDRKPLSVDRTAAEIMVVCANGTVNNQLRQALKALGFAKISTANSHTAALDRAYARHFTHVIFDAKDTEMPALEFVEKFLQSEENAVLVAISEQPRIDDVFSLLRAGARAFLVPPFTADMIEEIITLATDGPQLSEAVLNAPDRNAAFVAVILNSLYRLSVAMRQAREFPSAQRDVTNYTYTLREAVEMAALFCEGNESDLREKIVEGCINRAKDAATRLGRVRKKLQRARTTGEAGEPIEEEEEEQESQPTN